MFGRDKNKGPDLGKINEAISSAGGSGVRNLSVRQNGNVVEIHGQANSIADKQNAFKTITDRVGDAAGVVNLIQVAAEKPAANTAASPSLNMPNMTSASASGGARTHAVAKGETLSHIAQRYYGKASEYNRIFEANRNQLSDPDKIREGMTLTIPG